MVWSDTLMLVLNSPFGRIALQSEGAGYPAPDIPFIATAALADPMAEPPAVVTADAGCRARPRRPARAERPASVARACRCSGCPIGACGPDPPGSPAPSWWRKT